MIRLFTTTSLAALALAGAAARAQDGAAQAPQNDTLPQTIPGLENFSLPSSNDRLRLPRSAPSQIAPTPRATPTPTAPPTPRSTPAARPATPPLMIQPLPTPTPRATAAPRGQAPSRGTPTPTETAPPEATPTPEVVASPTPVPAPLPETAPVPAPTATAIPAPVAATDEQGGLLLPIVLGLIAIALAGLAWLFLARRRAGTEAEAEEQAAAPIAVPVVPPRRITPTGRPQLELGFRPRRAGMNVLSAAVDYELVVRNAGTAPARGVRVALQLVTAGERHDAELRRFLDAPVTTPIVAEFDLAPGDTRNVRAMAMLPKEAVNVVRVQGRPMFVPMVAINALYEWGDGQQGQTATSHVVGIARPGTPKMQPFWLDAPPRMYDGVGEHAHAIAVNR
ncbi:MAG TPA: hypothetical protein VM657_04705 [Sphingomonas sp.]|nr:hypothetical protein [Sphingomonas sp.]